MTPSQRLSVLGEGRLLQIRPTQVSDSGRYLCVATNVAGEDDQDFNVLIQGVCYCRVGWAMATNEPKTGHWLQVEGVIHGSHVGWGSGALHQLLAGDPLRHSWLPICLNISEAEQFCLL